MPEIIDMMKQASDMLLKAAVKGVYDLQKLRVSMGNRLVAQFKVKMGYVPGTKEEDTLDEVATEVLDTVKENYKKLTDGVKRILPSKAKFKAYGVIHHYAELVMVHQYMEMEKQEESLFRKVEDLLEDHPLWTTFLSGIRGCGPALGAVIISSIDITKAEYPSSLWKFCGFDVVRVGRKGKKAYLASNDREADTIKKVMDHGTTVFIESRNTIEKTVISMDDLDWRWEGRRKRTDHMVNRALEVDGVIMKTWKSLPYNPWLKSRLWLLGNSFLRCGNTHYRAIYEGRKNRSQNHPDWMNESAQHIHDDALRFMIKRFLVDLYKAWRPLEGLPVAPEYSEAKLGLKHKSAQKYAKKAA